MSKTKFCPVGQHQGSRLGGAGCNAVTRMVREQIHGVEFIAMNTMRSNWQSQKRRLGYNLENVCAVEWAPARPRSRT